MRAGHDVLLFQRQFVIFRIVDRIDRCNPDFDVRAGLGGIDSASRCFDQAEYRPG